MFGINRPKRLTLTFQLLITLFIAACASSIPASSSDPDSVLPSLGAFPTPTPFQPLTGSSSDPYLAAATPQVVSTFTPNPAVYIPEPQISVPVEAAPADSGVTYYNPLTGLPVEDPSFLQRRPLAIKIANSPDYVRPQSGLTLADVVYEYYIEWGDTRFIAVFYSNSNKLEQVGNVRSGRYFDEHIVRMYHSFLFFKGADDREMTYFRSLDVSPYMISVGIGKCPPYFIGHYKRDDYNNIFFNTTLWEACAEKKGLDNGPQSISGGFFSEEPPVSDLVVNRIYNFYSDFNYSYWEYDPKAQNYVRYQEEKDITLARKAETYIPLTDAITKLPVTAENVVELFIPYIFTNENQAEDEVYNPQFYDYGKAYVFRDGVAIPAYWVRTAIDQPILLTRLDGTPIYLRPGQTFYQVMGVTSRHIQNGADWRFEFQTP